jgi:thiol-disulfide isomerase/thioredoxin
MFSRRTVIVGASAMALAGPALAKVGDTPLPPPLAELGALALTRADGSATTLGAEAASGRAAVVSLWATWCAPCVMEAQHLAEVRGKYAAERLSITGINVDKARDEQKIAAFLKKGRVNFTQLRGDPEVVYQAFRGSLPITLPRLYVFDRAGNGIAVFGKYSGGKTLKEIDTAIASAVR